MNPYESTADGLLRRAELAVARRVHGLREGDHLSLLGGHGVEAGEARPYSPGDDVRRIDWTVTARTGVPHVRDAIAEREVDVLALLDLSGSLDFGTEGRRKCDLALAVLAGIGSLATRGHDRLGAVFLTGDGPVVVPLGAGRTHLVTLLTRAAALPSGGSADLAAGIERLDVLGRRRGIAVVISDFLGPMAWERPLRRLAHRHEVLAVELADPRERTLPDVGYLTVVDAETGCRRTVDTGRPEVRAAFVARARERADAVSAAVAHSGADHLPLSTDSDWVDPFVRFLERRRHQRTLGRAVAVPTGALR